MAKNGKKTEFDAGWLKGLKFSTAEVRTRRGEGGKEEPISVPVSRALTEADVLDYAVTDTEVILVAADGQKHRVPVGKGK